LVDFGDVINRVELSSGQLTADVRQFEGWINAIQLAGGGYDIPEFSLGAMQRAAQMSFRDGTLKLFIVITDAPPHHYGDPPDASVSFGDPNLTLDRTVEHLVAANVTTYIIAPPDSDYVQIARETNGRLFDIHGPLLCAVRRDVAARGEVLRTLWSGRKRAADQAIVVDMFALSPSLAKWRKVLQQLWL
jgi:hypothetical protein